MRTLYNIFTKFFIKELCKKMCKGLRRCKTVVKLKTDTVSGSPAKGFIERKKDSGSIKGGGGIFRSHVEKGEI